MKNSTVIPPTGISLSEDVDTTPSFIFAEYDQDLRVLRGCYKASKSRNNVEKKAARNRQKSCMNTIMANVEGSGTKFWPAKIQIFNYVCVDASIMMITSPSR